MGRGETEGKECGAPLSSLPFFLRKEAMSLAEQLKFLCQYVLKPTVVGAVAPSSPSLARKMVEWIDWNEVRAVVEYGPGTGAFTRRILSEIRPGTRFFAIEVNGHFVDVLRRRYPEIRVYRESVAHVQALCERDRPS
jgi:phospholipid N-methyltransferase